MAECGNCGEKVGMPFKCKFCAEHFCSKCRLPESHNCLGLANMNPEEIVYEPTEVRGSARVRASKSIGFLEGKVFLILLGVTLLFFVLQTSVPGFTQNVWLDPDEIYQRPWTFVTSVFAHGGITHLFVNMLFLFMFGMIMEKKVGSVNFLLFYIAAGILANIGYLGVDAITGGNIPALGASGALYGVFAALAILEPNIMVYPMFIPIPVRIQYALVIFAIYDVVFAGLAVDNVAHTAHLSGMVAGLIYAFWLKKTH